MSKTVAYLIADGSEPVEVVAPVDALRRGGAAVTLVSAMDRKETTGAQDVALIADALIADVDLSSFDMVVLPGGSVGVENLGKCEAVTDEVKRRMAEGEPLAAICAAPMILADLHVLDQRRAVCYPGCQTDFPEGVYQAGLDVCVDGNLITATGPGTALPFGIALLRALAGGAVADEVAAGMLLA